MDNVLVDDGGNIKLFNYGLYYMTNGGKYVTFPIGCPKYFAPEVFCNSTRSGTLMHYCDIWSLGLILLELVLGKELWVDLKLPELIRKLTGLRSRCSGNKKSSALFPILEDEDRSHVIEKMSPAVKTLIEECLIINPSNRPWPKKLLKDMRIFSQEQLSPTPSLGTDCKLEDNNSEITLINDVVTTNVITSDQSWINCRSATLPFKINFSKLCSLGDDTGESDDNQNQDRGINLMNGNAKRQLANDSSSFATSFNKDVCSIRSSDTSDLLKFRSLKEVYYLWQLAGGDVIAELRRQGLTRKKPAVLSVPK